MAKESVFPFHPSQVCLFRNHLFIESLNSSLILRVRAVFPAVPPNGPLSPRF